MLPLEHGVSSRDESILSTAKPTPDWEDEPRVFAQFRGLGCQSHSISTQHLDESLALCNYLNKTMSPESAARAITAGFSHQHPGEDVRLWERRRNKLWELLASTLLRFDDDCDMIVDLLVAIQSLPSVNSTPWWVTEPMFRARDSLCELPSFHSIWQTCYESLQCNCHETKDEIFRVDKDYYRRAGRAEAKMYLRGIPGITEYWAYRTINLICAPDYDFQFVLHEIHGWLQTAGPRLAETLDSNKIQSFERAARGRPDKRYQISATMFEHWQHWKKSFLEVSFDEDLLYPEERVLARECHDIMKAQKIKLPLFL